MNDLKIEVEAVKERCGAHHKPGDVFFIRGNGMVEIPKGKRVCVYALNSLLPFLLTKQRADELPGDDWISETEHLVCPDPKGVVFRVAAVRK